jgi:hypothetical protein
MDARLMKACIFALLLGAGPFVSSGVCAVLYAATADRAYGSNVAGRLYSVDSSNAESKLVGRIRGANGVSVGVTGMALHPETHVLYGTSAGFSFPPSLVTIDGRTAEAKVIGPLGFAVSDISFDRGGHLYAWLSELHQLGVVNLLTGAATPVGPVLSAAETTGGGLAIDKAGTAYVIPGTAAGTIDKIDLATMKHMTGAELTNAPYLSSINSLTFSPSGGLYGVNSNMAASAKTALVRIDPQTGVVTKVGDLPEDTDGLTFSPDVVSSLPPQTEMLSRLWPYALGGILLALAAVAMVVRRRRGRRIQAK